MQSMLPLLLLVLCISSCTKYPDAHPHRIPLQIASFTPTGTNDTCLITYNSKGDPLEIISAKEHTWYFLYDQWGRLTDYYQPYNNLSFDVWHRFVYDNRNRVIRDTVFEFSEYVDGNPVPDEGGRLRIRKVASFTYDHKNRIIKVFELFGQAWNGNDNSDDTAVAYYTYNTAGNLTSIWRKYKLNEAESATPTHDNKVNVNSLHPIWQLLARDYSVNNSYPATSYNQWGLPLDLDYKANSFGQFADFWLPKTSFVYTSLK